MIALLRQRWRKKGKSVTKSGQNDRVRATKASAGLRADMQDARHPASPGVSCSTKTADIHDKSLIVERQVSGFAPAALPLSRNYPWNSAAAKADISFAEDGRKPQREKNPVKHFATATSLAPIPALIPKHNAITADRGNCHAPILLLGFAQLIIVAFQPRVLRH